MRRRLVHARLLILLMKLRLSAELSYDRRLGLISLHRRLILLIGNYGGLTSVELVALSGHEKAQISRAVKGLAAAGLIERAALRARIVLSAAGHDTFARIIAIAAERNDALTAGLDRADRDRFGQLTVRLTDRAATLLANERRLSGSDTPDAEDAAAAPPIPRAADPSRPMSHMVAPLVTTLITYLQRSATIAYRREAELSNFGWQLLSQIGEHAPIALARLIAMTARDKSQVGRTVRLLEETGAVERRRIGRRREIVLATTAQGSATYADMCVDATRRDDYLFADWEPAERDFYLATLDALTDNAEALLQAERGRVDAGPS